LPAVEAGINGLPATGDSPAATWISTLAGLVTGNGWIQGAHPDPIAAQRFAPCPTTLLRPRAPQPTTRIDFAAAVQILK
jgi:hypothetical protein